MRAWLRMRACMHACCTCMHACACRVQAYTGQRLPVGAMSTCAAGAHDMACTHRHLWHTLVHRHGRCQPKDKACIRGDQPKDKDGLHPGGDWATKAGRLKVTQCNGRMLACIPPPPPDPAPACRTTLLLPALPLTFRSPPHPSARTPLSLNHAHAKWDPARRPLQRSRAQQAVHWPGDPAFATCVVALACGSLRHRHALSTVVIMVIGPAPNVAHVCCQAAVLLQRACSAQQVAQGP